MEDLDQQPADHFEGIENPIPPGMTGLPAGFFDGLGTQLVGDILPNGPQCGIKTITLTHSGASFPTGCVTTPWYRKPSLLQDQATKENTA
jgi:hypothetical protein